MAVMWKTGSRPKADFLTAVPLELSETDTELTVRAEVPGFNEKDLEIVVEPGHLFVTGKSEKQTEEKLFPHLKGVVAPSPNRDAIPPFEICSAN